MNLDQGSGKRGLKKSLDEHEQLFFMHIPKTAGTSLIALLDQRYVMDEICPLDRGSRVIYNSLPEEDRSRYKFIRGHFPYSLIDDLSYPRTITFLRDPVKRTLSAIDHHKRLEEQDMGFFKDISLADLSLEEFIDHPILGNFVVNKAVKYLNDMLGLRPLDAAPAELSLAKERLETFDFIGITERFEESMELLAHTFGFAPIQDYQLLQSGPKSHKEDNPQLLLDRLAEMNRDEIELYQYGLELFELRLAQMKQEQAKRRDDTSILLVSSIFDDFRRVGPGRGWHVGEKHPKYGIIRWSGPAVCSYIDMPLEHTSDLMIRFRVLRAITPEVLDSLKLEVNGVAVQLFRKKDIAGEGFIFQGLIPKSALEGGESISNLKFKILQTHQPDAFDRGNPDVRQLGLCYNWLHIYPA